MKKFLVITGNATKAEKDRFTEVVKERCKEWWHRLDDVWMVIDESQEASVISWRNEFYKAARRQPRSILVFEIDENVPFCAHLPKDSARWFREVWDQKLVVEGLHREAEGS